jgi:hypothetical protein
MTLKPGKVDDFTGSMAEAMEEVFKAEWWRIKGTHLLGAGEDERKILFSAIAKGVVKHLREKARDAFKIDVDVIQKNDVLMESDNPNAISISYGLSIATGRADVKQLDNANNMLVSEGHGTIVEVLTDE